MADLTVATLCQVLANITRNRCTFVETSNTCRCIDSLMSPRPANTVSSAPNIMLSEVFLIFFVLALWLSAIGFCLNQYKSLRRLETQVHYCGNRKDPLNIGDIKIVEREQDSIIYKKKRYSTVLDTHINSEDLRSMHYVKEYLPKSVLTPKIPSSAVTALVFSREELTANVPLATTAANNFLPALSMSTLTSYTPLSTHDELAEEQQSPSDPVAPCASLVTCEANTNKHNERMSFARITDKGRVATGLTVPRIPTPSSLHSCWNSSYTCDTSRSAQLLSVPSSSLRINRYSDGNISFSIPETSPKTSENTNEQLLDPRLISKTVRRSLLALHRESQENINFQRNKEKTQSENDVHGAFTSWKIKMKSKLKRTHHRHTQPSTPHTHSSALSVVPPSDNSNERERRVLEYKTTKQELRFSTPPLRYYSFSRNPSARRSLKHYPKYSTQSTTESETTQFDSPHTTSIYIPTNDNKFKKTIDEIDSESAITPV
ncbi:unnamed protein product [Adineta ricciae]|uniref:Uncharacterized protein n=1 Tax=Adineta ricciae TaxID=249248 RepID=A0A814STY3_ADIRI|nr:unnamed protein product [Adineta ricciae]CAF1230218.1 unnamed protein product [Adineta ricciae]